MADLNSAYLIVASTQYTNRTKQERTSTDRVQGQANPTVCVGYGNTQFATTGKRDQNRDMEGLGASCRECGRLRVLDSKVGAPTVSGRRRWWTPEQVRLDP